MIRKSKKLNYMNHIDQIDIVNNYPIILKAQIGWHISKVDLKFLQISKIKLKID